MVSEIQNTLKEKSKLEKARTENVKVIIFEALIMKIKPYNLNPFIF